MVWRDGDRRIYISATARGYGAAQDSCRLTHVSSQTQMLRRLKANRKQHQTQSHWISANLISALVHGCTCVVRPVFFGAVRRRGDAGYGPAWYVWLHTRQENEMMDLLQEDTGVRRGGVCMSKQKGAKLDKVCN